MYCHEGALAKLRRKRGRCENEEKHLAVVGSERHGCSRRANMHLFSVELMMMMMMVMMKTRRAVVNALACGLGRDSN